MCILGGNLLFVGHAGTLDLCTRSMVGKLPRKMTEYRSILPQIPYVSTCAIEENAKTSNWRFIETNVLPISNGKNQSLKFMNLINR